MMIESSIFQFSIFQYFCKTNYKAERVHKFYALLQQQHASDYYWLIKDDGVESNKLVVILENSFVDTKFYIKLKLNMGK